MNQVPKDQANATLAALAGRAAGLRGQNLNSPEFKRWRLDCDASIRNIFGSESPQMGTFRSLSFTLRRVSVINPPDPAAIQRYFNNGLEGAEQALLSMADEVMQYWPDSSNDTTGHASSRARGNTVFIIHGHDLDFAEAVARLVEKQSLTAVILHEQPNKGATIIEKFEANAAPCAFAVALFTPDDEGREQGSDDPLKPRARQNVLLELGYFMGALGRDRVAVLHKPGVELPSDCSGVIYIPADSGWRERLLRELEAAGLPKPSVA